MGTDYMEKEVWAGKPGRVGISQGGSTYASNQSEKNSSVIQHIAIMTSQSSVLIWFILQNLFLVEFLGKGQKVVSRYFCLWLIFEG